MAHPDPHTPAARRRLQQREDARRAILDAAEALLVEAGYEAFSMRRLARRCGYTAPTVYHYFGDKLGLIDALLEERVQRLLRRLRRAPRSGEPIEDVRALAGAFVRFGLQNPSHYRLLTAPRPEGAPPSRTAGEVRDLFEQPLHALIAEGRLEPERVEEVKQCLWMLLHGVISMKTSRPDEDWAPSLLETALDAMLRGLFPEPGAGARAAGGSAA